MHRGTFLLIYLVSGAAALLYEVLWLRLLTLSIGHTAAAVGILLAAFMGGLAFGAWAAGRAAGAVDGRRALQLYAVLELGIACCALLLPLVLAASHPLLAAAYADGDGEYFTVTRAAIALLLLAVPAAAMGATYPLAVRALLPRANAAGLLYAVNTAGAAAGAAATGFLLLPAIGMFGTTLVGVALNVVAAAGAYWLAGRDAVASGPPAPARAGVPRQPRADRSRRLWPLALLGAAAA